MLYRYEVKGIQSFVLRSSKLKDIAAASALVAGGLDEARNALLRDLSGEVVASAAGSATLQFARHEDAAAFAEVWPLVVAERLPGPQLVAALAPGLEGLHERLQQSRNVPMASAFDLGPLVARAGRSGGGAVCRDRGVLQDAVHARLKGREESRAFEVLLLDGGPLQGRKFLTDNNQLGRDSGYLALIHADGNGVGKKVIELLKENELGAFQVFSETLKRVTVQAVRQAIEATFADLELGDTLPMRPVVVGGDDVTVLVGPEYALPFTEAYLQAFEAGCKDSGNTLHGFSASAAIVFAKSKAPFYAVHDVCESLCGWVKEKTGREVSALGVHRITASPLEPFSETMKKSLSAKGMEGAFLGGPYAVGRTERFPSVARLRRLMDLARELPRGGLREWLRVRQEDNLRAGIRWDRLAEVATASRRHGDAWREIARSLDGGHWKDTGLEPSLRQRSPLLDVLNLNKLTRSGADASEGGEA